MSVIHLAEAIKKRELSQVEVVRNLLARIGVINPKINTYGPKQGQLFRHQYGKT